MRILYVTNGFPYPLTSGYLRHYFLIRELSQRHSITLFSLVKSDFCEEHVEAMRPYADDVLLFRRPDGGSSALHRTLSGSRILAGWNPAVKKMWGAVDEWSIGRKCDVAFFSGKFTLPSMRRLWGLPVVADICDAGSVRIRGRLRVTGWLGVPSLVAKYYLMRRLEKKVMRQAAHSVFASTRDRDALTDVHNARATVVPNGVDIDYWKRSSVQRDRNKIIFTGAMHYAPNADAASHLIEDIFPAIQQAVPDAELMIVGKVTGFVDDMRPYLQSATVCAAPLRFAAGIQNKILEAMAMEMHVIASPAAAGGVRTEDGLEAPIEIVEGKAAFAQAIVRELRRSHEHPGANPATREYVQKHFAWQNAGEKLEQVLCRVARRKPVLRIARLDAEPAVLKNAAS
jgi:glycosyltransferase involved in cell wall biosynthesis